MKSILFTHLKDKLLDETKDQTYRVLFIPTYEIGEIVEIKFKTIFEVICYETLYLAEIKDVYPKQIKDVSLEEAKRDGFESVEEFQRLVMKINRVKSKNRWGFIIRFKKIKDILEWLSD